MLPSLFNVCCIPQNRERRARKKKVKFEGTEYFILEQPTAWYTDAFALWNVCFKSGVLVPLDPHFLWQLLKLSDVSRCFYYEFWGEKVGCFRLAIPLKVTTHPSWQHSFCVATLGFWASTVSSATPFLLTLWSDTLCCCLPWVSRIFILHIMVISCATW